MNPTIIPTKLPLFTFVEGDKWGGIPTISILVGPPEGPMLPPDLPLELVTMRFKRTGNGAAEIVALSSADNEITIVSAAGWDVTVPAQIVPLLTAGKWTWQMRFWTDSADGDPLTYLAGDTTVLESV
jgi:hypothetical protein